MTTPHPFSIDVPQATLDDLQARLANTRWDPGALGTGWDEGTEPDFLRSLVDYWQHQYDWRAQEARLNSFDHFQTRLDDYTVHYIHMRGNGPNPKPLLLTHGWPDSFYRMVKIIPMLTDPQRFGGNAEDAFDVIVPSLPGFGFSEFPTTEAMTSGPMTTEKIADLWARLMSELGYERFVAAGGDMGSEVTLFLAHRHPQRLTGIHLTDVGYPMSPPEGVEMSAAGEEYLGRLNYWWMSEAAYMMPQSTKPQTLAYALNDSPVGLAAWIVEKFHGWSDHDGDLEAHFSKDDLLTNIMIYWVTQTAGSAARLYAAGKAIEMPLYPGPYIETPVGVAHFPKELLPPQEWVERAMNVQRWTTMPRGGHFAALEEPELLVDELRAFVRGLDSAASVQ